MKIRVSISICAILISLPSIVWGDDTREPAVKPEKDSNGCLVSKFPSIGRMVVFIGEEKEEKLEKFLCTCILINYDIPYILTSAHCLYNNEFKEKITSIKIDFVSKLFRHKISYCKYR